MHEATEMKNCADFARAYVTLVDINEEDGKRHAAGLQAKGLK